MMMMVIMTMMVTTMQMVIMTMMVTTMQMATMLKPPIVM